MKKFASVAGLDGKHCLGQALDGRMWLGTITTETYPLVSVHFVPMVTTMDKDPQPKGKK